METEPDIFDFMSKGILVAASEVQELDRGRHRLNFEDPDLMGIIDGGHNSLAAGRHIIKTVVTKLEGEEAGEQAIKGIKTWAQLKEAWQKYLPIIKANKEAIPHVRMPIEVIYPSDEAGGYEYFLEKILTINAARNNNAELTLEARANKLGHYDKIRDNLDPELVDQVEWKTNDGGRIKVRDFVALSLIPLSKLGRKATEQVRRNPTVIFSSKGQCVKIFDDLMDEDGVTAEVKGNIVDIVDPAVKSALAMMKDLPRLFDLIYANMPESYNKGAGGKFGKIDGVKKGKFKTPFYREPCEYRYGEGFIYPLVYGLTALMRLKDDKMTWITSPDKFVDQYLSHIMKSFYSLINGVQFDPAKVGKSGGAYNLAYELVAAVYKDQLLKEHGLI